MDENKRRLCRENGIKLIEISYELPRKQIGQYILDESYRLGIIVPHPELKDVDYNHFNPYRTEKILQLRNICKASGIDFSDNEYVDNQTKIEFKCKGGHTWSAAPNNIKKGKGCPDCFNLRRPYQKKNLNIEQMQALGVSRGGRCKSTVYVNNRTPLEWECAIGHSWWAQPKNVKGSKYVKGTWCPICASGASGKLLRPPTV